MNRDKFGKFAASLKARIVYGLQRLWFCTKIAGIAVLVGIIAYSYGVADKGNTVYAANVITVEAKQEMAPVLQRIADCESGSGKAGSATHYEHGQVLLRANAQGTNIDIGKYQINIMFWGKKATELKLDLTKEEDNYKMAVWIYQNKGTSDWSASQKCWYR